MLKFMEKCPLRGGREWRNILKANFIVGQNAHNQDFIKYKWFGWKGHTKLSKVSVCVEFQELEFVVLEWCAKTET